MTKRATLLCVLALGLLSAGWWDVKRNKNKIVWTYTEIGAPYFTNTATSTALHMVADITYVSSTAGWTDSRGTNVHLSTSLFAGRTPPTSTSAYRTAPNIGTLRAGWKIPTSTYGWVGTTTAQGLIDFSGSWTACEVFSQVARPSAAADYSFHTACQDAASAGWNTQFEETGVSACPVAGAYQVSGVVGSKFACSSNAIPTPFDGTLHVVCYGRDVGATTYSIMLDNGAFASSAAGAAAGFSTTSTCLLNNNNNDRANTAATPTGTSMYEYISFSTTTPTAASFSALQTSVAGFTWPNLLSPTRGCLTATVVLGSSSTEQIIFGANSGATSTKLLSFAAATTTPSMTDGNGHTVTARLGLVKGAAISLRAEWSNILGTMVLWNLTTVTSTSVAGFTSLSSVTNATSTPGSPFFKLDWITLMKLGSTERACD